MYFLMPGDICLRNQRKLKLALKDKLAGYVENNREINDHWKNEAECNY